MATTRDAATSEQTGERQPRPLWRNRDYLLLWGGQALSDIGGAVSALAYPLLVLAVTHAPAQAGFVAALGALPATLVSLPAGALVDRWDRRRVMLACDVGRFLCLGSIPVAYALGRLTIGQLYVTAFLEGALMVVFNLAKSAAVAQVVARAQLTRAIAQEELVEGTTALCGPSLAGILYTLGAMAPFITDAVTYVVSLVTLALVRTPFQQERTARRRRLWAEIAEGARWVWRQPFILTMTLLMGAGALVIPSSELLIIVLAQRQHASAAVIGVIVACFGVGAIVGAALLPRLGRRLMVGRSILVARWYYALSWPLYALAPVPLALGAIQFGSGVVEPVEDVPYFSHRLELIPEELRGRVLSACRVLPGTMRPLGLALTGILIQRAGIFPTIWIQSAWLLVITGIVTAIPYVRRERAGVSR
jgi:MFS family permease